MKNLKNMLVFAIYASVVLFLSSDMTAYAKPADKTSVSLSLDDIHDACSTKASCETDLENCVIMVNSENPYDVDYDYGNVYDFYVDACDWSLVFDADFYKATFPMLALQYHDDKDLLLRHFQTVGVHEGRQGSKSFNVGAYMDNCKSFVSNAFGEDYAAYYVFYMLNYKSESSVDTVNRTKGNESRTQYATVMTAFQARELEAVNEYRESAHADAVEFDSELGAFANYRAYLNAHDGWEAHDWFREHGNNGDGLVWKLTRSLFKDGRCSLSENTITNTGARNSMCTKLPAVNYDSSKSHHDAMVNPDFTFIGISNMTWNDDSTNYHSQFDVFTPDNLDTPAHPGK